MVLSEDQEVSRETINLETARINWKELEVYYAASNVISVSAELDLTEVALQITKDNAKSLKDWMSKGKIDVVTDDQAKIFHDTEASVWAVVIKPWILIQSNNGIG